MIANALFITYFNTPPQAGAYKLDDPSLE